MEGKKIAEHKIKNPIQGNEIILRKIERKTEKKKKLCAKITLK